MKYRFLIFGAGAIGTYIGGSLCLQGHDVVFLEREGDLETLRLQGLRLIINGVEHLISSPQLIGSLDQIQVQPFDLGILALKTYHLDQILPELIRLQKHLPPILCLQNGVESEKVLTKAVGEELVIPGTVTTAVDREGKGEAIVRRLRGMAMANNHPISQRILPVFNQAGLNLQLFSDPDSMKWSKLLINLLGNASSAILNMTPHQIFSDPSLYGLELEQLRETLSVMRLLKINPINLPGVPVKLLAFIIQYLPRGFSQPLLSKVIGSGRGGKMPSFHIDLYSGRGKCEVDQLNGAVVRAGKKVNHPTPVNQLFDQVLQALIRGDEPLDKYANHPETLLDLVS